MPSLTPQMMLSFQDELEKQAISFAGLGTAARQAGGYLARQGTTVGSGAALGGTAGGLLGVGAGGMKKYREARQQGATGQEALRAGLGGAGKGALTGAAIGAGVGGTVGLAGGQGARDIASKLRSRGGALGALSRFGERQVHGVTGAVPEGYASGAKAVRAMRGGAYGAEKQFAGAAEHLKNIQAGRQKPGMVGRGLKRFGVDVEGRALKKAVKGEERAQRYLQAATKAEEMGLTSLPGYAKALVGKGKYTGGKHVGQKVKGLEAFKAGIGEQWHSGGPATKALTYGFPAAALTSEAITPSKPGGEGKATRMGKSLGGFAYGMAPLPLAGVSALTSGLTAAGGLAGRGIDRVTGRPR